MKDNPYARFKDEELIVRDYLAGDRTALANERTLLSYIRTALGFALAGGSVIHFLDSLAADFVGGTLLALAVAISVFGLQRFRWYKRRIEKVTRGKIRNDPLQ